MSAGSGPMPGARCSSQRTPAGSFTAARTALRNSHNSLAHKPNQEEEPMDDKKADVKSGSILSQKVSRRSVLKAGLVGAAGLTAGPIFEACSIIPSSSNNRPNKIVIGTFQDNAMVPFRDVFEK